MEVLRRWAEVVRRVFSGPGPERDTALLLAKATLATVLAWQFAVVVMHSPTPFYAPMAALLVVDRTMVRSVWASVQRVAAVVVGMSVAWLVGSLVGVHWWTMAPVIFLSLLIARWRRLGTHGIQVPTMVLLSLLTSGGTNANFTAVTIVETVVGGAIGVAVNWVVLPPLHIREPRQRVASLSEQTVELLRDMASGLRGDWGGDEAESWSARATAMAALAPPAEEAIARGEESTKLNPRDNVRGLAVDWVGYSRTVDALRRAQWQIAGIARTLVESVDDTTPHPRPSDRFLAVLADVLDDVASGLEHFGIHDEASRTAVRDALGRAGARLDDLGTQLHESSLDDPAAWPAYGGLLLDARRLVTELATSRDDAVLPTDSGPFPHPAAES